MRVSVLLLLCALIAGCGSSGSTAGNGTEGNILVPQPTPAPVQVVISTSGPAPDTVLYAAQFTLALPKALTVPGTAGGLLPAGVLQPALGGSFAGAGLVNTGAEPGQVLLVNISHPGGFTVGPLATLNCTLAPGAGVASSEIVLSGFSARDSNGAPIAGIVPHLALKTQ
jgi:hypothetical protein